MEAPTLPLRTARLAGVKKPSREDDMSRTVFVMMLLAGVAAHAQERAGSGDPRGTASGRVEERSERAEKAEQPGKDHRDRAYQDYVVTSPPGYFITPWGGIIFPDAPPPMGDTSTLSGAGPNVSEGPVVGDGPEVSSGPVVGPTPAGTPGLNP